MTNHEHPSDDRQVLPSQPAPDDNDASDRDNQPAADGASSEGTSAPVTSSDPARTSRDVLYESIGLQLVGAGILTPAKDFVDEVRREAGFRVAPRDIAAIVTQIAQSGTDVSARSVAEIATSSRGDRSQRQQRNPDQWRALGAVLSLRGLDGSPDGQRAFIGEARRIAGKHASDALVLQITLAVADAGAALDAETVGKLGKRLAHSAADIDPDAMGELVHSELRTMQRAERAAAISKRKKRSSSGARRAQSGYPYNPGARKLRPGRRNIRSLPEKEA